MCELIRDEAEVQYTHEKETYHSYPELCNSYAKGVEISASKMKSMVFDTFSM